VLGPRFRTKTIDEGRFLEVQGIKGLLQDFDISKWSKLRFSLLHYWFSSFMLDTQSRHAVDGA
jgi:hypothetical protein